MKTITYEQFLQFKPCYLSNPNKKKLMDSIAQRRERWSALDILALDEILPADRLWAVLREELIDAPILHEIACRCAERALSRIENPDPRSLRVIEVKRAWLRGKATDEELAAAEAAARAAARYAAEAARYAAWAALAAAWDSAEAARYAAWAAARYAAEAARYAALDSAEAARYAALDSAEAARYAAWAARYAALDSAEAAAEAAAQDAALAAAWAAERQWQIKELQKMLMEVVENG